jgi:hypothetical protein
MTNVVTCERGFVARSEPECDLIEQVREHAKAVHNIGLTSDHGHPTVRKELQPLISRKRLQLLLRQWLANSVLTRYQNYS